MCRPAHCDESLLARQLSVRQEGSAHHCLLEWADHGSYQVSAFWTFAFIQGFYTFPCCYFWVLEWLFDSTISFFDVFLHLLILLTLFCAPFTRSFFWLKSSQGHGQASGHIQMNLKRLGYELQVPSLMLWSLLTVDAIALLILGSGIKLSLPLDLYLVGCSRVWSLNGKCLNQNPVSQCMQTPA